MGEGMGEFGRKILDIVCSTSLFALAEQVFD